jgi:hypothetical protein
VSGFCDRRPEGDAVALVSFYDRENNAVRQLASGLRHDGRRVLEIYFKDWRNNRFEDPTDQELRQLADLLRREGAAMVGLSLRASAYQQAAAQTLTWLRAKTALPVIVGGWHATVRPDPCLAFADALCLGEADATFPLFVRRFFAGDRALPDTPGHWVRWGDEVRRNAPAPLVDPLDALPWRDYASSDKWVLERGTVTRGDPMRADPLWQVMCSIGCIQKCSFCHNSFDDGAPGARLRFRSVQGVLDELAARRRANPAIRRVRFDDEIFGLDRRWLREFAERWPTEVGLPFDVLTEPTVVSEVYADLLQKAGARWVHMGIQSTESVNRDRLERRASREMTQAAVERLTRRGMRIRYLTMVDIPGVADAQKEELFRFFLNVPRPYDLYLFSLTHFPGSKMVEDQLAAGALDASEIEGAARKTFAQYRVDLGWPRDAGDTWWIALLVLQASGVLPPAALDRVVRHRWLQAEPRPLVLAAHAATVLKTARIAARMVRDGELTPTLVRRWWNPQTMITM